MKKTFFLTVLSCSLLHSSSWAKPEIARPADALVESIGIGTRFDWMRNDGRLDIAERALKETGIRYIRTGEGSEGGNQQEYVRDMKAMALRNKIGVVLCIHFNPSTDIKQLLELWAAKPSPVYALEGPNETFEKPDWGAPEWQGKTSLDVQKLIWSEAQKYGFQTYSWTLGGPADYYFGMPAEADKYTTHGNFHPYHWYSEPGGRHTTKMNGLYQNGETRDNAGTIAAVRAWMKNPEKPLVSTEYGWGMDTLPTQYEAVSEEVQAKYLSRAVFENFNAGLERAFIYSLASHNDDFGIVDRQGKDRQAKRALQVIIALTGERGFHKIKTTSLDWALTVDSKMPVENKGDVRVDEIHHTLLQKKNGRFILALWANKDSHKGETSPEPATLKLGRNVKSLRFFRPIDGGITPVKAMGAIKKGAAIRLEGNIAIPDSPLLIEITP